VERRVVPGSTYICLAKVLIKPTLEIITSILFSWKELRSRDVVDPQLPKEALPA
jgi:hypothetical protein